MLCVALVFVLKMVTHLSLCYFPNTPVTVTLVIFIFLHYFPEFSDEEAKAQRHQSVELSGESQAGLMTGAALRGSGFTALSLCLSMETSHRSRKIRMPDQLSDSVLTARLT